MELTIDQALQRGTEAHKSGKVQEADRFYTAIIKVHPKHPDANHNMGVLAVGVGKAQEALPFFKIALEANPMIEQYWFSYIDALIKLDKLVDAKAVFNQAKEKGFKGGRIEKLGQKLKKVKPSDTIAAQNQEPSQNQLMPLIDLYTQGQMQQALSALALLLGQFPNSAVLCNFEGVANSALGRLDTALGCFKRAIFFKPGYADAYYNMGNALKGQHRLEEAITAYKKALAINPEHSDAVNNLGVALQGLGNLEEAVSFYKTALSLTPKNAERTYNMGNALQELGRLEAAIHSYKKTILLKPDYAEAFYNMGNALNKLGRQEEATEAYKRALVIRPNYAEANNNMGIFFRERGDLKEAIKSYKKALAAKPDYAEAYYNIGNALQDQGKLEEAIENYNQALDIKPDYAEAFNNLGISYRKIGNLKQAIKAYQKALISKPQYAEPYNNIGNAFHDLGKLSAAIKNYSQALAIKPDYAEACNNLGISYRQQGKLKLAKAAYEKALTLNPNYADAHRNLSNVKKYTVTDDHFIQVQGLYQHKQLSDDVRCNLSFVLAKVYDDLERYDRAFPYLIEGNSLRKKLLNYNIIQDQKLFSKLKKSQPRIMENSLKTENGSEGLVPIFILGMPRSGSTLVEQILSSHSQVTGAGELVYVPKFGSNLVQKLPTHNLDNIPKFREKYLSELAHRRNGNRFVTDKLPHNFLYIALICAALPEAKIIHVQREAAATCWSNFKHYFSSGGLGYSNNLVDVVTYHNLYQDLMQFWQTLYSDRIYHLSYERIVKDQTNQIKNLLQYLSLSWEDTCLNPQDNKRNIQTASAQQVRQGIYRDSSQVWRNYEPYLKGAFDKLI